MRFFLSIFAFLLFCFLSPVYPHAILKQPTARQGQAEGIGIKVAQSNGPTAQQLLGCGGTEGADPGPGPIAATYTAGQTIRVGWDITIIHSSPPGVRIALKYSDTDSFDKNLIATGVDVASNRVGDRAYTDIKLPTGKTSQNAVLQWIWYSTEDRGYYIACSDIRINAATGGGGGSTTTAPITTTSPISTTTTDPDAETTESPETTESAESTPEATEIPITDEPEEPTTKRPVSSTPSWTGTTSIGTVRTTTRTTTRRATNPNIGQNNAAGRGGTSAAINEKNIGLALMMASIMTAFMRLFH